MRFESKIKYLPWKIRQFIKLIYNMLKEVPYPHSDFPLIGKKSFFSIRETYVNKVLKFENDKFEYHSKIYNDSRIADSDLAEVDVFRTTIEILPGKMLKNYDFSIIENSIFHISRPNMSPINVVIENKKEKKNFDLLNINNRFISFSENNGSKIKLKSSKVKSKSKKILSNKI